MNSAANSHSAHLPQVCSLDSPVLSKSYSIAPASRPRYPERVSAASMVLPAKHPSREHSKAGNFSLTACVMAVVFFPVMLTTAHKASALGFATKQQKPQQAEQNGQHNEIAVPLPKSKELIHTDGAFPIVHEYHP